MGADLEAVAIRMIHACGMVDIASDVRASEDFAEAARHALSRGADILCDCEAVQAGISRRYLKGNALVVTLNDERVPELAKRLGTTRSAAAVELWRELARRAPSW